MKLLSEHPLLIGRMIEAFNGRSKTLARRRARLQFVLLIFVTLSSLAVGWFAGVGFFLLFHP